MCTTCMTDGQCLELSENGGTLKQNIVKMKQLISLKRAINAQYKKEKVHTSNDIKNVYFIINFTMKFIVPEIGRLTQKNIVIILEG